MRFNEGRKQEIYRGAKWSEVFDESGLPEMKKRNKYSLLKSENQQILEELEDEEEGDFHGRKSLNKLMETFEYNLALLKSLRNFWALRVEEMKEQKENQKERLRIKKEEKEDLDLCISNHKFFLDENGEEREQEKGLLISQGFKRRSDKGNERERAEGFLSSPRNLGARVNLEMYLEKKESGIGLKTLQEKKERREFEMSHAQDSMQKTLARSSVSLCNLKTIKSYEKSKNPVKKSLFQTIFQF